LRLLNVVRLTESNRCHGWQVKEFEKRGIRQFWRPDGSTKKEAVHAAPFTIKTTNSVRTPF
jgi:hypothetical protein